MTLSYRCRNTACLCTAFPDEQIQDSLFLGELSLDGSIRHTNGILPMVALASERRIKAVFLQPLMPPKQTLVEGVIVYPVETLGQLVCAPQQRTADLNLINAISVLLDNIK